ncbi:Bacteriophage P22, Gp10, DNA-stabilising [uncultured Caudovirales phage]|uniref:Bacteriophage P22, Gp10, DNA-stabilising n=1 Tax=uncultured Caudovirales phage TaxID=2100421 RepID=A0A6J5MSV7_9CAUD|nr:Bacteriophage P22, Gp10, DNA-stabilising [uncultured Caudovirales phage]CAB4161411.1 Bacteriophage P22, Gp10, DNA-stabilising [uncultured Caudovirales phage]
MKTPILGSAYVARSVNAADNRMVNLYPEIVPEGGKEAAFLQRAPGLRLLATVGTGPIRGLNSFDGNLYVVSGESLYKVDSTYVVTLLGTVSGSSAPVSMANNGTQLFVACNGPSFVYNSSTLVFGAITDSDFPGALTVSYLDGYFVFIEPSSQRVWVTALNDPTSIDPLDFASAEGDPDGLISSIVDHSQVWLFGTSSVEVWYNSGNADFPLQRIEGAFNELGCAATFSVAKLDNSLFWLGQDARGQGIIYRANGYTGQRISTHAVEWQIQQYADMSDAVAYTYQQDGHSFYVLNFPSANATWVYDVATQAWHERAGWINGQFVRHRGNCQTFFNQTITVGDYQNGNIYAFDMEVYADYDRVQKWLRTWRALPTGQNNLKRTVQHTLQLDCETGVGLVSGQGSDPQVMLRWSDDAGHTWSNEHWSGMGAIGQYGRRVFWRRLGMTTKLRDRVYEASGTDPVKVTIVGAELLLNGTNA